MRYKRLQEENRNRRRTVVDAIETLKEQICFQDNDRAELRIWLIELPSGDVVGLVNVFFESLPDITLIVSLPTSIFFRARQPEQSEFQHFDIAELDGASLDGAGNVELKDGTRLRAVEVVPARLPYEISELDWRIVNHTVSMMGAEERCYVHPSRSSSPKQRQIAREHRLLDVSTLVGLGAPPLLKQIKGTFLDQNTDVKNISEAKISDTLSKFGMRRHARRPRKNSPIGMASARV
jgi:hypothetical protein